MSYQGKIRSIIGKKQKGALLVEVILATFIITTGLLAVMQLITGSLKDSFLNRDAIVATGLSQEGAEMVRNIRDNSFVNDINTPFKKFTADSHLCYVAYSFSAATIPCSNSFTAPNYVLEKDKSGLHYTHSVGRKIRATKFSRMLYINYNNITLQAQVTSFVWWGAVPDSVRTGGKGDCTVKNKCVFTDVVLTKWK